MKTENQNSEALSVNVKVKLGTLKKCFSDGVEAWRRAGEILVELLDVDGQDLEGLHEASELPMDVLATLEKIGRKQVNPRLLVSDFPAARVLERLPMSEQDKLLREPVDMMVVHDGKADVIKVAVQHMTRSQVKQVFARNYVRPLNEQRAFLEGQCKPSELVVSGMPYEINTRRHSVVFKANCEVSAKELARLLAQLQD
jgi:hypothetical protein